MFHVVQEKNIDIEQRSNVLGTFSPYIGYPHAYKIPPFNFV